MQYWRISNGAPVASSSCSTTWDVYEIKVTGSTGVSVDSYSTQSTMRVATNVVDGNLGTYWMGDPSNSRNGLGTSCWSSSKIGRQWIIVAIPLSTITKVEVYQSESDANFRVSHMQYETSTDFNAWTAPVLVSSGPGWTTLYDEVCHSIANCATSELPHPIGQWPVGPN